MQSVRRPAILPRHFLLSLLPFFSEQPGPDTPLRVAPEPILPCVAVYPWKIGCQVLNTHILKRCLMAINGSVICFLFGFSLVLFSSSPFLPHPSFFSPSPFFKM